MLVGRADDAVGGLGAARTSASTNPVQVLTGTFAFSAAQGIRTVVVVMAVFTRARRFIGGTAAPVNAATARTSVVCIALRTIVRGRATGASFGLNAYAEYIFAATVLANALPRIAMIIMVAVFVGLGGPIDWGAPKAAAVA